LGQEKTYIIPQTHDENPWRAQGLIHLVPPANLIETVTVAEGLELGLAEFGRNGIPGDTVPSGFGHFVHLAALDKVLGDLVLLEASNDARKIKKVRKWCFWLRYNSPEEGVGNLRELRARVNRLTLAVEIFGTHAVGIEIAAYPELILTFNNAMKGMHQPLGSQSPLNRSSE